MSNLIPEKLQQWEYYLNKLPIYLQNSKGFSEHFKIWFDLLVGNTNEKNGLLGSFDEILSSINIFDKNFPVENTNMLDNLGSIFGLSRNIKVTYIQNSETITESLSLSNAEFLLFIRARIIQSYFNGSYSQMKEYYTAAHLDIITKNDDFSGSLKVYLNDVSYLISATSIYSKNIQKMFLAGLLNIQCMGIRYRYSIQQLEKILFWDLTSTWDSGEWAV